MSKFEFIDICSPIESVDPGYRSCRKDGLVFAPHLQVLGAASMAPCLQGLKEYQDARSVLIVDDGVASALVPTAQGDLKGYYLMDPHDGSVVQPQSGSPWKYNLQGFPPQSSFSRLPQFDLVLSGCHGIADGCLYTSGHKLVKAFGELSRHGKISGYTCVVAMVNQYQYDHAAPCNLGFARARYAIVDGIGTQILG